MRLLFAIPHFHAPGPAGSAPHGSLGPDSSHRVVALTRALTTIQQLSGRPQCVIDIAGRSTTPANQLTAVRADVVICTTGGKHLLDQPPIDAEYFTHLATTAQPRLLGFECHAAL